jgi:hypothetical protein
MAWFQIRYSKNAFLRSLDGAKLESLAPPDGLDAMIAFYRDFRAQHTDHGDDVLEFVWKTDGELFQLAICRRMLRRGSDQTPHTLELAFRFAANDRSSAVAGGQLGCQDVADLARFRHEVTGSAAWKVVAGAAVRSRSLEER